MRMNRATFYLMGWGWPAGARRAGRWTGSPLRSINQQSRICRVALLLRELLEEFLGATVHFFPREVFLAGGNGPRVTEGVGQSTRAIAPELVAQLTHRTLPDLTAGRHGTLEQRVAVLD